MRVTAKDVARLANVSEKTVSRVVNGQGEIRDATRARVLAAIEELRYRPNWAARSLASGRTRTIGVVIPDITDPFFPELILAAEGAARSQGYGVFLCNTSRTPEVELQYIHDLSEKGVDGLLIAGSVLGTEELLSVITDHNCVVLTPNPIESAVVFSVDDTDGVQQLGQHLISLGHRTIGFIEAEWTNNAHHRRTGLGRAFTAERLSPDGVVATSTSMLNMEGGRTACLKLLAEHTEVTSVVCHNDVLAFGALEACRQLGKRVPEDISVVGFDDVPEAARSTPALTTFRLDRNRIGKSMMEELIRLVGSGSESTDRRILIPGELIIRDSTARAPVREP